MTYGWNQEDQIDKRILLIVAKADICYLSQELQLQEKILIFSMIFMDSKSSTRKVKIKNVSVFNHLEHKGPADQHVSLSTNHTPIQTHTHAINSASM